ncbi:MAG: hypothetical protein JWQ09_5731 [Segetibacter sp.]|nr:hypothetical protein [Segetibacter sp.]
MNITQLCETLKKDISQYDIEGFVGFFAYFLRQGLPDVEGKDVIHFESKQRDLLYLLALRIFSENSGTKRFKLDQEVLNNLATRVKRIKDAYHPSSMSEYTTESVLHEMAFQNYFHNGTLSYVEQDLEKIRRVFSPFNRTIEKHFGFDVDTAIEIYKHTELNGKIKFHYIMAYAKTEEFQRFKKRLQNKECSFDEAFDDLPQSIQEGFLNFFDKTHAFLTFTPEDLCLSFEPEKVQKFLDNFSCAPDPSIKFLYYTDENPLDKAPILKLPNGTYLHICQKLLPAAIYNRFYDLLLNDQNFHDKVRQHREKQLEKKVTEIFKQFFPKGFFFYENYKVLKTAEQDLLILWKGFAFIIEVKASKLHEPFSNIEKAVQIIKKDFKKSIQYGYEQCRRIEGFFKGTQAFEILNKRDECLFRVQPHKYHTIFSIIVTLERWGALQTDLKHLLEKEDDNVYPWSVYIDDLETILMSLNKLKNPVGAFITYLKERQKLHGRSYSIDELDICSEYMLAPEKFSVNANNRRGFMLFSASNQGLFDELYYARAYQFNETAMPDFQRYFRNAPKDWEETFS